MLLIYAFVFLVGLTVGSFLNVVIARLPEGRSLAFPASHCPHCKTTIKPYDNIPLLSFLLLRGKCRACKAAISWRYPLVELLTGALFVIVVVKFGFSLQAAVYVLFTAALVAITFIDLDHQIIPDSISLPGTMLALLIPAVLLVVDRTQLWPISVAQALIGFWVGALPLALFAGGYYLLTKTEGLGIGDMKLLGWVGALLGWQNVLLTIVLGSLLGSVITLPMLLFLGKSRKTLIPFGPFLAAGAFIALLIGQELLRWWLNLSGALVS